MKYSLLGLLAVAASMLFVHQPVFSSETSPSGLSTHVQCGYDLNGIKDKVVETRDDALDRGIVRRTYSLEWDLAQGKVEGVLILSCSDSSGHPEISDGPVKSPRDLIFEEDAGGRYGRHVAWEKALPVSSWSARVAYVDYTLGDGQRANTNEFLACNSKVATPCISLSITRPNRLTVAHIDSVLITLSKITLSTSSSR